MKGENVPYVLLQLPLILVLNTYFIQSVPQNSTNFNLLSRRKDGYNNIKTQLTTNQTSKEYLFKDFIMKFSPNVVFNRIEKKKMAQGLNSSINEDFLEIFDGIDPTDELLRLNVEKIQSGRRKWSPPGRADNEAPYKKDVFSLRRRLFELMRHTMYRTRNKLVIMQELRDKYRNSSLYKMGFLISRIDTSVKSFTAYTYRTLSSCVGRYYGNNNRHEIISMMTAEERMVNKWFEIELLIDLLEKNDEMAKECINKHTRGRKEKWKYVD